MKVVELNKGARAPKHLKPETARWFLSVLADWALDEHHVRILTIAASAWDRAEAARTTLDKEGVTYLDRWGAPHSRPENKIEIDSRNTFLRCIRELDLDLQPPPPPSGRRPPTLRSNRAG